MKKENQIITKSSGNVFADLGLENSKELLAKSTLARTIREIIKQRKLTQTKAAELLVKITTSVDRFDKLKLFNWRTSNDPRSKGD